MFGFGWSNLPVLSFLPHAGTMVALNPDLAGLRSASVIQGTASVAVIAVLARMLFGWPVALLSALVLSVAHWHVHFSRMGISNTGALLVVLITMAFTIRLARAPTMSRAALVGMSFGACSLVYFAARLTPVIAVLFLAYSWYRDRTPLAVIGRSGATVLLGMVSLLAPFGVAALHSPGAVTARLTEVSVFSAAFQEHASNTLGTSSLGETLRLQALWSLEGFAASRDTSLHYSTPAPLLEIATAPLAAIGLVLACTRVADPRYFLVVIWFALTLLFGAVLTDSAPFSPRILGTLPALAICVGLAITFAWGVVTSFFRTLTVPFAAVVTAAWVGLLVSSNVRAYFETFATRERLSVTTEVGRFLQQIDESVAIVVIHKGTPILTQETPRFLAPRTDGIELTSAELELPLSIPSHSRRLAVLVLSDAPGAAEALARIKQAYPGGAEEVVRTGRRTRLFTSYEAPLPV
jgi:hypothetical protein